MEAQSSRSVVHSTSKLPTHPHQMSLTLIDFQSRNYQFLMSSKTSSLSALFIRFIVCLFTSFSYSRIPIFRREPPRKTKIGSKNRRVREIRGKITMFDFEERKRRLVEVIRRFENKNEGFRNRDST